MNYLWLPPLLLLYFTARYFFCLGRNVVRARRSGLPYIVIPWTNYGLLWRLTYSFFTPILSYLPPQKWWKDVLEFMRPETIHHFRQKWFDRLGDTFLVVGADLILLRTNNAEVNFSITSQREKFQKWQRIYSVLRIFGPNIVTTEGAEWRRHRRLIAGAFSETNTALVFHEAIQQSQSMLRRWTAAGESAAQQTERCEGRRASAGVKLKCVDEDVERLALHIIAYVGFGLRILWPGEELHEDTDKEMTKNRSLQEGAPVSGYDMLFPEAMHKVQQHILLLLALPIWLLNANMIGKDVLPFESARQSGRAARNYLRYLNEMMDERLAAAANLDDAKEAPVGMDLLGHCAQVVGRRSGDKSSDQLPREALMGNSFILQVAGQETTATTLHLTMVYLACFPEAQRQVQRDLDVLLGERPDPNTWEKEKDMEALLASHVGAAMYETLRLLPPVCDIPKVTHEEQLLMVKGRQCMVPKGAVVLVGVLAAQINPRYWPTKPSRYRAGETDIDDYVPERWFRTAETKNESNGAPDTMHKEHEKLGRQFRPVQGSYAPFSDGARSCIGRRFALAEIMAAMAVIYSKYSVELVVNEEEGEDDDENGSDEAQREHDRDLYIKARQVALNKVQNSKSAMTLGFANGKNIDMRIVPRGEGRFVQWME